MLALVESTGSHPALADKRDRAIPNGVPVPSSSPPLQTALANGTHQDWDKHEKSDTRAAEFIKTESELGSGHPEGAERRLTERPVPSAAAAEDDDEAELLAAEAQAAAQLEEEEAAAGAAAEPASAELAAAELAAAELAAAELAAERADGLKAETDEEGQCDLESISETVAEDEFEDKPSLEPKDRETAPSEIAAKSPEEMKAALAEPLSEATDSSSAANNPPGEPMLTEDPPSTATESSEAPKRLRSQVEATDKVLDSDKSGQVPRKKVRRGSANALDLSASAETERRPSLLLCKLEEKQDGNAELRRISDEGENRPDKIFRSESERAQVLREMRDRVLSSYKSERTGNSTNHQVQQPNAQFSELERERLVAEAVEAVACSGKLSDLEKAARAIKSEIRKLTAEAHAKELEWNALIRKRKLKEEVYLRLHRRKQVLVMSEGGESSDKCGSEGSEGSDAEGREGAEQSCGEQLLAVALRLGSRSLEEHCRSGRPSSPGSGAASGPLPGGPSVNSRGSKSSNGRQLSLLQSQLSKPQDSSVQRPQLLMQQLQRQRNFLLNNVAAPACRLSSSVSLSAIPTTSTPTSFPNSHSGVKTYLSGSQGAVLGVEKAGGMSVGAVNCTAGIGQSASSLRARPILPKPTSTSGGTVVSMLGPSAASAACAGLGAGAGAGVGAGAGAFCDGGGVIGEGRQGPIVDVQSIIADYRSKHPENVPRRGRRLKPKSVGGESGVSGNTRPGNGGNLLSMALPTLGCGGNVRTGSLTAVAASALDFSELGLMLTPGGESPSSTESSLSGAPPQDAAKDVLMQFAKLMSQAQAAVGSNPAQSVPPAGDPPTGRPPPPPYPEVTLHPVLASNPGVGVVSSAPSTPTTSLLHGILSKPSSGISTGLGVAGSLSPPKSTTFSPTLARLLTAPERSSHVPPLPNFGGSHASGAATGPVSTDAPVSLNDLLASAATKARSELTITPVGAVSAKAHQKSGPVLPNRTTKSEVVLLDGEEAGGGAGHDGDADAEGDPEGDDEQRLVIDESPESLTKESVPACQSCQTREAEFVCAGCNNQWYCSRECQITAWDQHSEVCSL